MMERLANFYRGKRVLVTGHTGFKGSWLSFWLAELGAEVHGCALAPAAPSLFDELRLTERLASHRLVDVRAQPSLVRHVREVRPEVVFHLAAQALVLESYRNPIDAYAINLLGTVHLLDALRAEEQVRVIQVITTDKCYENAGQSRPFREDDPLGGADPYSSSKACAELAAAAYRKSFFRDGPSLSSVRAGNVIGGGDWAADRIVPDCIRALEEGKPIRLRNPAAIRPWQFVLEPLAGYLELARRQWEQAEPFAQAWNFGPMPDAHASVGDLAQLVLKEWGGGSIEVAPASGDKPEAAVLRLDITKSMAGLGWRPIYAVEAAVAETVAWYRQRWQQGSKFDARAACREQIRRYIDRAGSEEKA